MFTPLSEGSLHTAINNNCKNKLKRAGILPERSNGDKLRLANTVNTWRNDGLCICHNRIEVL